MNTNIKHNLITLQNKLTELQNWENPTRYKITEDFPKHGKRTYSVTNLICEQENEIMLFTDIDKQIQSDYTYVLNAFCISSVQNIKLNNLDHINAVITFPDGTIRIEDMEVLELKSKCHEVFDSYWQSQLRCNNKKHIQKEKNKSYRRLSQEMHLAAGGSHFSRMNDVDTLKRAYNIILGW